MKRKINMNLNQLSLPFQAGREGRTRSISYEDRSKIFWFLTTACLFSLITYIYAVNATARNVSLRASLERESSELNSELATLEFQYIAERGAITLGVAQEYGFQEVAEPLYVAKNAGESLSFNTQKP